LHEQNWEDIVLQSLSYLIGNKITLNVHNDEPAHLIMSLKTLIDFEIKRITTVNDEVPNKLKIENSRGTLTLVYLHTFYHNYYYDYYYITHTLYLNNLNKYIHSLVHYIVSILNMGMLSLFQKIITSLV
jgi:hypothetical protein